MGANQSGQNLSSQETDSQHGITVVNSIPNQPAAQAELTLPSRVLPILTIEDQRIDSERHEADAQLDSQIWVDIVLTLKEFIQSRADLVATRQSHLREKVAFVDELVQNFTDFYVNDKHKALARLNENSRELDEVSKLLQKCTTQGELCADMLNKLNTLLPDEHRAQPLGT